MNVRASCSVSEAIYFAYVTDVPRVSSLLNATVGTNKSWGGKKHLQAEVSGTLSTISCLEEPKRQSPVAFWAFVVCLGYGRACLQ